jgi:hypothetical protein
VYPEKGTFILEELDGSQLGGTITKNRLKRFNVREETFLNREEIGEGGVNMSV